MKLLLITIAILGLANAALYLIYGNWYHAVTFGLCAGWLGFRYLKRVEA